MRYRNEGGRASGNHKGRPKLDKAMVAAIRAYFKPRFTKKQVAEALGVSAEQISLICRDPSIWRGVGPGDVWYLEGAVKRFFQKKEDHE